MNAEQLRVVRGQGLLLHLDGADIRWCVGAPMTSAGALTTRLTVRGERPTSRSSRAPGTTAWSTELRHDGDLVALLHDDADPARPTYAGLLVAHAALRIELALDTAAHVEVRAAPGRIEVLASIAAFAPVFVYPAGAEQFVRIVVAGPVALASEGADGTSVPIAVDPGEIRISVLVGPDLAAVLAEPTPYSPELVARSTFAYRREVIGRLPADLSPLDALLDDHEASGLVSAHDLVEASAYLVTAQQAPDGAVIAGAEFPLAYLRDTYGIALGLRAMGLDEHAAALARFRIAKWAHFGDLANAESIGHDRIRHRHEHDDAESPAYAMLQALDALADDPTLMTPELDGMLDWCWRAQESRMIDGTLPFNGDETYLAGGFLDRAYIAHASFESTLLAVHSARAYARYLRPRRPRRAEEVSERAAAIATGFRDAFTHDGEWVTAGRTRFDAPGRFGVCESCGAFPTSTARRADARYTCVRCRHVAPFPFTWAPVFVPTAMLLPALIPGPPLPDHEVRAIAHRSAEELLIPDGRSNGHDIPLCLLGLGPGHPSFGALLRRTLSRFDRAQGWSERYVGDRRDGSRLRPWETALHVHALQTLAGAVPKGPRAERIT